MAICYQPRLSPPHASLLAALIGCVGAREPPPPEHGNEKKQPKAVVATSVRPKMRVQLSHVLEGPRSSHALAMMAQKTTMGGMREEI